MPATPRKPTTLDPRAERLLEWMGAQPWARFIVLGGGVALKHYLDYRGTKDCDAWWHPELGFVKCARGTAGRTKLNAIATV